MPKTESNAPISLLLMGKKKSALHINKYKHTQTHTHTTPV